MAYTTRPPDSGGKGRFEHSTPVPMTHLACNFSFLRSMVGKRLSTSQQGAKDLVKTGPTMDVGLYLRFVLGPVPVPHWMKEILVGITANEPTSRNWTFYPWLLTGPLSLHFLPDVRTFNDGD